mmetsp:Transcript_135032/g.431477  ORF Transcript_135032/g.431477 Transcript_135032/m.431477 type:complete len:257 (+) Transcript_135032:1843-2613(+)
MPLTSRHGKPSEASQHSTYGRQSSTKAKRKAPKIKSSKTAAFASVSWATDKYNTPAMMRSESVSNAKYCLCGCVYSSIFPSVSSHNMRATLSDQSSGPLRCPSSSPPRPWESSLASLGPSMSQTAAIGQCDRLRACNEIGSRQAPTFPINPPMNTMKAQVSPTELWWHKYMPATSISSNASKGTLKIGVKEASTFQKKALCKSRAWPKKQTCTAHKTWTSNVASNHTLNMSRLTDTLSPQLFRLISYASKLQHKQW